MSYNFLSLVNDICGRLNEVPLTQFNFAGATGFYSQAKSGINSALNEIHQDAFEWPFTNVVRTDTLVVNQARYTPPADTKSINFDSFRLKGDLSKNVQTTRLVQMDYEEYLDKCADADFNPGDYANIPRFVFRTPTVGYGVYPPPKTDYELVYEYYKLPVELELYSDVPLLPEQYRHMIVDGAMHDCFIFRGDPEGAAAIWDKFKQRTKDLRKLYQNRYEYVRSTVRDSQGRLGRGYW